MASGNTLCAFTPYANEPPSTNYATLDLRNGHPCLDFNDTTAWGAVFTGIMPRHYASGGITVYLTWGATTAITGNVVWTVEFERITDAVLDVDADGFAAAQSFTASAVPATSGVLKTDSLAVTAANADGIAVGDLFRLRVKRDAANAGDTMVGDAELFGVELKES